MKFNLIFLLVFYSLSFNAQDVKEKYIIIPISNDLEDFTSIPLGSKCGFVTFYSNEKDTSIVELKEGTCFFYEEDENIINFEFKNKGKIKIQGQYFIPNDKFVKYQANIDGATSETIISPIYYYVPVKVGTWIINSREVNYNSRYSNLEKYEKSMESSDSKQNELEDGGTFEDLLENEFKKE